ncbi:hypothetical protein Tco_1508923 [Tanacetum coccineum]
METKDVNAIKYKMSKSKERCMAYFRSLHSHLQVLSKEDLKGTRIDYGFKREFMSLFGQDNDTFTSTMLLNVDQLQKQLNKDEFQEDRSMAAFWVINRQFQMFIDSQFTLDYDSQMADKYFAEYTRIEIKQLRETLLQHMTNVKKSIAERTRHQRQYDRRVNKRLMQTQESNIDLGKALVAGLVVTESSETESGKQDTSSGSGNDTDTDDADIRPIYDVELMVEVQLTVECNVNATRQQHTEQPEIFNESRVDQYTEQCQVKSLMLDSSLDNKTTKFSNQSLESENTYKDVYDSIKKTRVQTKDHTGSLIVQLNKKSTEFTNLEAQIQEKVFAIAALKNELRKLKGNSVDTKFTKPSVLGKPVLQSLRKQSVVRQPNTFKSERPQISRPRFASQVDVKKDLSKPITQHYLPKGREFSFAKPHHVIASSESRNSSKNMPRFSSNDMVHNYYLEEAKKKTQEKYRNLKSSMMHSTRLQNTTNGSKPKPRINNQTTRSLLVSKSSSCQKCIFNANHDACITKFLKEVNSLAKVKSHKTRNSNKPVEQKSHTQKPSRQIFTGYRFSHNKSSVVYEKTSPRSCLGWKPTGRIFDNVGLRWIPTGKLLDSCTGKVASEPPHGSNVDISKIHECEETKY